MNEFLIRFGLAIPVLIPLLGFLGLGAASLLGCHPSDKVLERLVRGVMVIVATSTLGVVFALFGTPNFEIHANYGTWFSYADLEDQLILVLDSLSAVYLTLTVLLGSLVGLFSARYLRSESGALRFFASYLLFVGGFSLLVLAGTFDLLIAGWELLGLSSVFLIGFYWQRRGPADNALRTFATYRVADLGLLAAFAIIVPVFGSDELPVFLSKAVEINGPLALFFGFCLLWAAAGKSAQWPFSFWLPRAMEGPTPSSAIFYGALSVHAGAYLLLRTCPLWQDLLLVRGGIVTIGIVTAVYASFVGRSRSDVKTMLSYAAMAQVALIFIEIGLGFEKLALLHVAGHAVVRTLQFLRAPSALADWQSLGRPRSDAHHIERFLPNGLRFWLYRRSLGAGHLDAMVQTYIVAPIMQLANYLDKSEREFADGLERQIAPDSNQRLFEGQEVHQL